MNNDVNWLEVGKQLHIQRDGIVYLADFDIFIRRVGAGRLAGAEFERGKAHEGLVTQGR